MERENCDFISNLPDPILHHILGFLLTKEAIQTCVLSKRWEHLWTFLPSLNFNFSEFCEDIDDDSDDGVELLSAYSARFVKFVNAVLLRRKPLDLDVFHLNCYELEEDSSEADWIRYAMNHNTRVLYLSTSDFIPWSSYTCTSLEKLDLYRPHTDSDIIVNLPNLKALSISYADLDSCYVKNFLSGCPILEFLELDNCNFSYTDCIIAHEYLKYLLLVTCRIEQELFVSAPNLLSFSYEDELSLPCKTTLNMPSLAKSCLTSCDPSMIKCLEGTATCLRFLTNVELLELHFECRQYKELLASVLSLELPIFPNLKNVTVAFCMFSCFQMVTSILKSSPKLKKLTILQKECLSHCEAEASTNESTSISSTIAVSLHKNLKIVEVKYWNYNQMVRELVDTLKELEKSEDLLVQVQKQ
ncbi:putative F-box/LRR-repeat protein At3g18150 [Carex rostrata]